MAADHLQSAYDVVVIGGGPAGLSVAMALRSRGIERVMVLEREAQAGGIPRHCSHSPFGLREYGRIMAGPAYARMNVERALRANVEIRTGTTAVALRADGLVTLATPAGMSEVKGRRVVLCLGAREQPRAARLLGGGRPIGVINTGALQLAVALKHLQPFQRPLIVGTELVSLSAILTCRQAGIRPVAVIEPAARPVARWPLTLFPRLAGIPLRLGTELVSIEGKGRVEYVLLRDQTGATEQIACDGVLLTGCFTPESALLRLSGLRIDPGTGGPVVDQFGRCSDATYFAAGNLLRPVETAGWCWREGQRIAALVAQDLTTGLPGAEDTISLSVEPPLRYVMPQSLYPGQADGAVLQLRVAERIKGTLRALQAGKELARRNAVFKPERRILLPLPAMLQPGAPIEISIQPEGRDS